MTLSRPARIEELFEQIVEQPVQEHRRLLELACAEDRTLIEEVLSLLAADYAGNHRALLQNVASVAAQLLEAEDAPAIPSRFGRYVLQDFLGQGGMGRVYLAEREDLGDRVAIKFLQDAWSSPARRERFAREQRLLASLNHPHIARLYDAGVENGAPWFAMEFVEGVPINLYCRSRELVLRDRLQLFRAACEAVGYAHRNLTVHLDLKPSNILVNAAGEVKLLDFGIARNLDREGRAAEKTKTSLRLFSLNYAAPEQIRGEILDIQTDIHGLGVILYDLLTGKPPAELTNASVAELIRFTEEEVQRPSLAAQTGGACPISASKADWRDLDVVCQTALHRDRGRRYETAEALLRDLDHFLGNEPLEAHADSIRYRLGKFVGRNRRIVSAAAAVLLAVVALSLFFTLRLIDARDRALSSEARTQRINSLMLNLFDGDDRAAGPAERLRAVNLLDRGVQQAESLNAEPALQAQLRYTFGGLYRKLGRFDRAEPLLRSAWREQTQLFGLHNPDTIKTQLALALLLVDRSGFDEAEHLVRDVLQNVTQHNGNGSIEMAAAQAALGAVLAGRGDYKQALPVLENAVKLLGTGPGTLELSEALGDLGNTYYYLGQVESSGAVNQRALVLDKQLFGPRHPQVGVDLLNLGNIQLDRGQYPQAEQLFRQAVAIDTAWYGPMHPKTANTLLMLGRSLSYQGRLDEAAALYQEALAGTRAGNGEKSVRFAIVLSLIGDLDEDRNQLDKAESLFRQAAGILRNTVGEQHEFYAHELSNLASVDLARKQYPQAEKLLRVALGTLEKVVPEQRITGIAQVRLGAALAGKKRYGAAERQALAGYLTLRKGSTAPTTELQSARKELYAIYTAMKQPEKAIEFR